MALNEGDTAPDFTLATDNGGSVTLSDLRGKPVVVYFYPKDDTPGCTKEAQGFTEAREAFDKLGVTIIGISKDTVARHDKFKAKYDLNFILASDTDTSVCEDYGAWGPKKLYGREYEGITRCTFLIDGNGVVAKAWPKVKVAGHVDAVLEAARAL